MKFSKMKKDDALKLTYKDLAFEAIKEKGVMNTATLFRMIIDKVEGSNADFENKIASFYTNMTTDKRFILLDDGTFDLRENQGSDKLKKLDDDEMDDLFAEFDEEIEEEVEDDYEDDKYSKLDKQDYDEDEDYDDFSDLVILDDDELEE